MRGPTEAGRAEEKAQHCDKATGQANPTLGSRSPPREPRLPLRGPAPDTVASGGEGAPHGKEKGQRARAVRQSQAGCLGAVLACLSC